jgi:hypothetical protein
MECRKYYNEDRPHGAIGNKPPGFPTCRLRVRASLSFRVWVPIPDLRTNPITRDAVSPVQLTRVPINRICVTGVLPSEPIHSSPRWTSVWFIPRYN